jgi:hypothetical protein
MSPRFRPPGKTFQERWPHEVEETRYFASTSYAVVLGGVLGVLLVPFAIRAALAAAPLAIAVIFGVLVLVMFAMSRVPHNGRRWLALAWKIGVWVLAAGALGLVVEGLASAMCDEACAAALPTRSAAAHHLRDPRCGLHRDRGDRRPGRQCAPPARAESDVSPIMGRCRRSPS